MICPTPCCNTFDTHLFSELYHFGPIQFYKLSKNFFEKLRDSYQIEFSKTCYFFKTKRSSSIPLPKVFLASNVNNGKVSNICNIILYVLLFIAVVVLVILLIICIMSWSNRNENEVTTTPIPQRKFIHPVNSLVLERKVTKKRSAAIAKRCHSEALP